MEENLNQKAEMILNDNVKNLELISYFKNSTIKTPIYLGVIQRNYAEIKPLINNGLIKDLAPVKSYIFNLDKLENNFYKKFQEKIDKLKTEIWRRKSKKTEIIKLTEEMEPDEDCEDYELKLYECLEFAKKSISELDKMEGEKEDFNNIIGDLQEKLKQHPMYKFLLIIRNDKDFIFNKRTEDKDGVIHKKVLNSSHECIPNNGRTFFTDIIKKGFYKGFSPAKNYIITELGSLVDLKLRELKWAQDDSHQKTPDEIAQEEEFDKLKEVFGF
ncbi:MAG: hypothetical protein KAX18_14405 [Candidatus Lokiarchaeota archaeon]|nr:hypothetical protein [Candidatus Lokiarchaeota archaeon]